MPGPESAVRVVQVPVVFAAVDIEYEGLALLVGRLDHAATGHHRAVEAAFGTSRAEQLMRELTELIEAIR